MALDQAHAAHRLSLQTTGGHLGPGLLCSNRKSFPARFARLGAKKNVHCHNVVVRSTDAIDSLDSVTFPSFLPPEVKYLQDSEARAMAARIQRLPVKTKFLDMPIMTSCVKPVTINEELLPVVLLHGFDSSCLEWRHTYPLLERANINCWAFDILGWGFSHHEGVESFSAEVKREHLYEFWRSYLKKPMILVGASLGGAAAIDFTVVYPEAVSKLVLVNAQGYAEANGKMGSLPRYLAYAGVAVLKSVLLRAYANLLVYHRVDYRLIFELMKVGRLHCFMPGWADASVDFMLSGGYDVASSVSRITKETLVIWGEQDKVLSKDYPERFKKDLQNGRVLYVSNCGHLPHVQKPEVVAALLTEFCKQ